MYTVARENAQGKAKYFSVKKFKYFLFVHPLFKYINKRNIGTTGKI